MLLNHLEISCRNLTKAKQIFASNFSLSLVNEHKDSCILKSNNINLYLKKSPSEVSRVTNIAFTCPNLTILKKNLANKLKTKTSEVKENCRYHPGVPFVDVASPFPALSHRVYEHSSETHGEVSMSRDIDHVLICCDKRTAKLHAQWYAEFLNVDPYPLAGSPSGSMKVAVNGSGMEMFVNCSKGSDLPIFAFSEPITNSSTGCNQIERFLKANHGGGVQHIALKSSDIFQTVHNLRENGVRVIQQPHSYYELEDKLLQFNDLGIDPVLAYENSVIVDQDQDGYLLQVFTESLLEKDGMFLEIIERRGSRGFGQGNVKALFSALQKKMESSAVS
ncbi:hypothetical protein ACHWQZ_G005400 [Mnemiopsis leidyi]